MSIESLNEKWQPVLEHADLPKIADSHRRAVTAQLLENTEKALQEGQAWQPHSLLNEAIPNGSADLGGAVKGYDPVLISLIRRSMPNLMAYDIAGVQPMTGPTGLIFALRPQYANTTAQTGEAFFNEADTDFSGAGTHAGTVGTAGTAAGTAGTGTADTAGPAGTAGTAGNAAPAAARNAPPPPKLRAASQAQTPILFSDPGGT